RIGRPSQAAGNEVRGIAVPPPDRYSERAKTVPRSERSVYDHVTRNTPTMLHKRLKPADADPRELSISTSARVPARGLAQLDDCYGAAGTAIAAMTTTTAAARE